MNISLALNVVFGSILVVVLIFVNYIRKFNNNRFQRNIFSCILVFHFITMLCDMVYLMFTGMPGSHIFLVLHIVCMLYYFFQVLSFCYMTAFVDYMVFMKPSRTKRIIYFTYIYSAVHAAVLVASYRYNFYFYIDPANNLFQNRDHFYIRLAFAYLPMLLGLGTLIRNYSSLKKSDIIILSILISFFVFGSTLDILLGRIGFLWPWGTSALLYAYFFIVRSDARNDPLTGIGNRFGFNEFTDRLSRRVTGDSWAIVMIDMDHFKCINDTCGHQEGDNALCDLAAIIKGSIGKNDFAARYGGDEFVLITKVEKGGEAAITALLDKILASIDQFNAKNIRPYKLEISYGYDIYTADGRHPIEEFLNHIDSLMYKNKRERRRAGDKKNGNAA